MTREIKTVHVLRARDLPEHPQGDKHEVNILIGGDKARFDTIFHFEIVGPGIVSSTYNVHILAMFEARGRDFTVFVDFDFFSRSITELPIHKI